MKVILPESIEDITLGQFQEFTELSNKLEAEEITEDEFLKHKIVLFGGIPYNQINDVVMTDLEDVVIQIDKALGQEATFKHRFTLNDIDFGFVENLDEITTGEYVDLKEYATDVKEMHKLMAILFRPIINSDKFGNYKVEKYNGTSKYADTMRSMPLSVVNGSLVFFCDLSRELLNHIQLSTEALRVRAEKHQSTLNGGDGIAPSMNWQKGNRGKWTM